VPIFAKWSGYALIAAKLSARRCILQRVCNSASGGGWKKYTTGCRLLPL